MAKKLIIIIIIFLLSSLIETSWSENSTDLFFAGFKDATAENLTLTGIAEVQPTGILRLTNDSSRLIGHAFAAAPVRLKNESFSTTFAFTVVPEYPRLGGHGLAFAVVASKDLNALPSQYLGLLNASDNTGNASNHLFAVEFDTVRDFEFGDINDNHVGVNINSMNSTAAAAASYFAASGSGSGSGSGSSTNFSLNGKAVQAWIDYDADRTLLNVTVAPFTEKPAVPLISLKIDLSPVVEEFMYVGFSASTGLLASSHYILGWSFRTNGRCRDLDMSKLRHLPGPRKSHAPAAIAGSAAAVFLLVAGSAAAAWIFVRIKNRDPIEAWELVLGPHRFSYGELRKATKGFGERELLGRGGFGRVYRGTLQPSKAAVAVKRVSHESRQGMREFVAEISTIGRLRHRNLVQLLGWCRRRTDLILVYEFMENGSLEKFLFLEENDDPQAARVLTWDQRVNVVNGVASALLYLHEGFDQVVVHRDVKASNVLLDAELNGRLGDFGLARLHDHGANMSTTRVVGTLGYLAPELPRTGKATAASDVFAFGALLLEVVSARRPIEPKATPEELVLVDWAWDMYREGRLLEVVDKRLGGKFDAKEAEMVAKLGLMCSNSAAAARPTMRQVVRYLEGEVPVPEEVGDPLGVYDERKGRVASGVASDGFDDFVHSFPTSSFDGLSKSHSFGSTNHGVLNASFNSLSASPLSLLRGRGESIRLSD